MLGRCPVDSFTVDGLAWEQASIVVNYSGRQWMTMDVCTWHGHGAALYCTQQLFSSSQLFMCEEGIPNVRQPYSTDQGWANLNWQKRQMKIIWEARSPDDDPLCSDNCRRTGLTRWHHLKDEQEAKVETVNKWKPQATRSGDYAVTVAKLLVWYLGLTLTSDFKLHHSSEAGARPPPKRWEMCEDV